MIAVSALRKYQIWIIAGLLTIVFLWMRFYKLPSSFDFTGDPGRDMLVLFDWKQTGKPPLLGPQTSAMPLNQSAVYFYLLYPGFLLSGGNPLSANVTLAVFWLVSLFGGLYLMRGRKEIQKVVLFTFFIACIHPLVVEQSRMVWNPSFTPPLITAGVVALFLLREKYTISRLLAFTGSLALATSLHFPAIVFLLAGIIFLAIYCRGAFIKGVVFSIAFMIAFNLPTIFFEMRHSFLISKSLLFGNWLGTAQFTRIENFNRVFDFLVPSRGLLHSAAIVLAFIVLEIIFLRLKLKKSISFVANFLFLVGLLLTVISKMAFHSHYIFGFLIMAAMMIAGLPWKLKSVVVVISLLWLQPMFTEKYFSPARRNMLEMEMCFKTVCEVEKEPLFVSVQAGHHSYHSGPEYRYLLKKSGCNVKYIESQPGEASLMAVVVDGSTYEHGKTAYNELTLFGESFVHKTYQCSKDFEVYILTKELKIIAPTESLKK